MSTQNEQENVVREARPGKGAAGDQWGVQMAQPVGEAVDPEVPAVSKEGFKQGKADIKAAEQSEEGTDLKTTGGYTVSESGRLNNTPIQPPVYRQDETRFGFTRQAEILNGRAAMVGFAIIVAIELITGQGVLSFFNIV
ncbi:MAG: chlorophyll a/b-binding protein [Elainellaceae cyanobacterium]